jgi:hypothetical protein
MSRVQGIRGFPAAQTDATRITRYLNAGLGAHGLRGKAETPRIALLAFGHQQ